MSGAGTKANDDPILRRSASERLNYATGMMLSARDFGDEQAFHRGSLALVLRHALGMGTLCGLEVTARSVPDPTPTDALLGVSPGVALDPFGRIIHLEEELTLSLGRWMRTFAGAPEGPATALNVTADVFVRLASRGVALTPAFADGPFDALDSATPKRTQALAQASLVTRQAGDALPRNAWPSTEAARRGRILSERPIAAGGRGPALPNLKEHPAHFREDPGLALSVFLARVTIPVTPLPTGGPSGFALDLARLPVAVSNERRPIITLPGRWLGETA